MPTALLYHADSTQLSFEATVVGHAPGAVILDRTAFYAEGGGQLADHGTLAGLPVTDVQIDDAGVVRHLVVGELPAVGASVSGQIDRARRRQYSALHTAQHMLSRALIEVAHAETVSARLGESSCTVDLDVPSLGEAEVARAEALVNALVEDDVSIRAWFPEASELASLPLRRRPKVSENVRVVAIGDFDVSPCGGTHCTQSAQVGLLEVTGMERYKGMMRVSFAAGRRARVLLEGDRDDGEKPETLTTAFRRECRSSLLVASCKGLADMLAAAGLPFAGKQAFRASQHTARPPACAVAGGPPPLCASCAGHTSPSAGPLTACNSCKQPLHPHPVCCLRVHDL